MTGPYHRRSSHYATNHFRVAKIIPCPIQQCPKLTAAPVRGMAGLAWAIVVTNNAKQGGILGRNARKNAGGWQGQAIVALPCLLTKA